MPAMTDPMPRVADVWANYWDAAFFAAYPQMQALYDRLAMPERAAVTGEKLAHEADSGGVERIVLSATDFPGTPCDNRKVAEIAAASADRIVGCASVDPRRGMEGVRELRRAVTEDGMRAFKVLPFLYGAPPNDAIYYPFYAACVDLDIPVLILTGHTAVMERSEVGRPLYLDDVALYFPDLTIVAGHAGFPWTDELIGLAWKHERVYIDTSGHRSKYLPPALKHFLNSYGREKVLFGTGYPFMDYAKPVADVASMDLRPESRHAFLWGNAAAIWGWS
jgi:predicted TIM-barrel fold metal-dependent hydrolase